MDPQDEIDALQRRTRFTDSELDELLMNGSAMLFGGARPLRFRPRAVAREGPGPVDGKAPFPAGNGALFCAPCGEGGISPAGLRGGRRCSPRGSAA